MVLVAVACAFAYTALSLSLPIIVQHVIDDAIVPDDQSRLLELLGLMVALTALRAGVSFCRRYATATVGIRVEAHMRSLLYDGYLRFPRAFYDRQPTGQVVSRATNDLYPIRYFVGWGSVQTIQSAITIVAATALMLWVDPVLTIAAGLCMPLIVWLAWRFASGVTPISRVIRQRQADVTESAEESVVGIEMVQAFGREDTVRERFDGRASLVRDGFVDAARVEARYLPAMFLMPLWAIGLVLLVGGLRVIDGHLTIGEFVLFQTVLLQLAWPLEALGWIIDLGQRAIASAGRSFAWLDGVRSQEDPAEPSRPARGAARPALRGRRLRLPRRVGRVAGGRPRARAGRDRRAGRADRQRQDEPARPRAPLLRPRGRRGAGRRRGRARAAGRRAARAPSPSSRSDRCCSPRRCARTSPSRARTRRGTRCSRPARPPASPTSSTTCRAGTTPRSASAA